MQLLGDLPEATMSGKKTKRKQKEASTSCCLSSACKNRTKGKEQESFSLRDPDLKRDQHHLPFHFRLLCQFWAQIWNPIAFFVAQDFWL